MGEKFAKGWKYRIYPNKSQEEELDFMLWQCRKVWNRARRICKYVDNRWGSLPSKSSLASHFAKNMRERFPDTYGKITGDTVRMILASLEQSYDMAKKREKSGIKKKKAGYPKYKERGMEPGLPIRSGIHLADPETGKTRSVVKNNRYPEADSPLLGDVSHKGKYLKMIYLSDPYIRIHMHRGFPEGFESFQHATITRVQGRWYISFTVRKMEFVPPFKSELKSVGIDVGLVHLVTESNGLQIKHKKWYTKRLPDLQRLDKKITRQKKANNPDNYDENGGVIPENANKNGWVISSNLRRSQEKRQRLHRNIANQRKHFWNNYIDELTNPDKKGFSLIVIEDITARFMINMPRLARLSADAGLSAFRVALANKCRERGVFLIRIYPAYTSQECSECGHTEKGNRLDQESFCCRECGHKENADLNAAKNIEVRGVKEFRAAKSFLEKNPDHLRSVLEASPSRKSTVCKSVAKLAGVHHWTTIEQISLLLTQPASV